MSEIDAPFVYRAEVVEVVDGDTFDVEMDLGFQVLSRERIRLKGVDTHETHFVSQDSEEYKRGKKEAEWVRDWLDKGRNDYPGQYPFVVDTYKDDSKGLYGRYLADIKRRSDGASLVQSLLDEFDDIEYE